MVSYYQTHNLYSTPPHLSGKSGRDVIVSVIAVCPLHALVALLRLYAERGDRPRFETANADRFVCLFTVTVGTVVYSIERRVDLGNQLAPARSGSKFDRAFGLE